MQDIKVSFVSYHFMVVNLIIFYLKTDSCNWRSEEEGLFTNVFFFVFFWRFADCAS